MLDCLNRLIVELIVTLSISCRYGKDILIFILGKNIFLKNIKHYNFLWLNIDYLEEIIKTKATFGIVT
jgi:hypothetical protein